MGGAELGTRGAFGVTWAQVSEGGLWGPLRAHSPSEHTALSRLRQSPGSGGAPVSAQHPGRGLLPREPAAPGPSWLGSPLSLFQV